MSRMNAKGSVVLLLLLEAGSMLSMSPMGVWSECVSAALKGQDSDTFLSSRMEPLPVSGVGNPLGEVWNELASAILVFRQYHVRVRSMIMHITHQKS
jgi:hypothetical protein